MAESESTPPDADWIEAVVDEYEGRLTLYASRLVGDADRGRDVVQDTFLRLWQADRAAIEGHLAKWLYTVCRNRAMDVYRKEHRMTPVDAQLMSVHAERKPDKPEQEPRLLAHVEGLPKRQQEALRLKFQGGLSYREIAEVMDTTANNVGVMLHTAIKTIRQRLADSASSDASQSMATR